MLKRLVESLIPDKYRANDNEYVRARTFAYGMVLVLCINLFHEILGLWQHIPVLVEINKITIFVAILTFFLFRAGVPINICMVIVFLDLLGLIGFFSTVGGGIESQILSWLGVLCSSVLLISTDLLAIYCFATSLVVILIFFILELRGLEFETIAQLKGNKAVFGLGQAMLTTTSFLITYVFFKNNKEAYLKLENKKEELAASLEKLNRTQQQLIQQEKLASLGSLTSGIAHEIQNPLNFVNNFSELVKENADEINSLLDDLKKKYPDDKLIDEAKTEIDFLNLNSKKIHEHGSRAERVIRAMQMHTNRGQNPVQPVVFNRLIKTLSNITLTSFINANDNFQCEIKFTADDKIETVNIIEQDITHALANILNNALYAVKEKGKTDRNFSPLILVETIKQSTNLILKIKDNGYGIPENIQQKIFEPFFTTKPTGEGTGLGLSICYEIIKAHGGEMKLESKVNAFTEFTITLPIA